MTLTLSVSTINASDVTKILSCRVNTASRQGIKKLGISVGSVFLLFFPWKYPGTTFTVARGNPQPLPLNNSPEWKKRICPISSHHYLPKVGNTSLKESLTSSRTSIWQQSILATPFLIKSSMRPGVAIIMWTAKKAIHLGTALMHKLHNEFNNDMSLNSKYKSYLQKYRHLAIQSQ